MAQAPHELRFEAIATGFMGPVPTLWLLDLQGLGRPDLFECWRAADMISREELTLAWNYRHAQARLQFLGGRALVRHAMSVLAGHAPREVMITRDAMGKPRLAAPLEASSWYFNISHSGNLVVCVVASSAVGVDIESTSRDVAHLAIAQQHFSAEEVDWIASNPTRSKGKFTALWTLKEAYLKAVGVGITVPLCGMRFSEVKRWSCGIQSADLPAEGHWHCRLLKPQQGYWLAVCSQSRMTALRVRRVEPKMWSIDAARRPASEQRTALQKFPD